jgi:hypothetical protein
MVKQGCQFILEVTMGAQGWLGWNGFEEFEKKAMQLSPKFFQGSVTVVRLSYILKSLSDPSCFSAIFV